MRGKLDRKCPQCGKVRISTQNQYIDQPISGYDDIEEGDYVVLTVADGGIGIAKDEIGRIFEPFYTRKVMDRSGIGLGMAAKAELEKSQQTA